MDWLIGLLPGGSLTAIGAAIVAGLMAVWRIFAVGKKAGRNEQKAKENDAYEEHIRDIERAADARSRAERDGVPDDIYDRDRR